LEEDLSIARDEVDEELQLASEQEACRHRTLHVVEIQENKRHRIQQSMALGQTKSMMVQKLEKEDGNEYPVT
jgi:hypothetical protein